MSNHWNKELLNSSVPRDDPGPVSSSWSSDSCANTLSYVTQAAGPPTCREYAANLGNRLVSRYDHCLCKVTRGKLGCEFQIKHTSYATFLFPTKIAPKSDQRTNIYKNLPYICKFPEFYRWCSRENPSTMTEELSDRHWTSHWTWTSGWKWLHGGEVYDHFVNYIDI
jgi:hypothetical protein